LEGILGMYYNGQEYGRPTHNFSEDLDIFGEGTLFHLLNRTKSKSGSDYLAQQLLGENVIFLVYQSIIKLFYFTYLLSFADLYLFIAFIHF
jgi:hypothetical protein